MTDTQAPRYFIFDCGKNEKDIEFIIHNWHGSSARPGDYFLYRRPVGASASNKFYFFGSGQIGRRAEDPEDNHGGLNCLVVNPIPFRNLVYGEDILAFIKERGKNGFRGFFSQSGKTEIESEVFKHILKLGVAVRE